MKNKLTLLSAMGIVMAFHSTKAQENNTTITALKEVVVTATKFEMEASKAGKIIYQIKPADLENLKGKTVADVLDNMAGITVHGSNSAAGKNKSVYIRGSRNKQVLVLIDGVPVSDPSGINTIYDLRLLTLSQVASIEVMNGAASTLYGSGAAAAVINIKLKEAGKKAFAINYETSYGTYNTQKTTKFNLKDRNHNIAVNGKLNKFSYLATFNSAVNKGFSEASTANSDIAFENDPLKSTNALLRIGYQFDKNVKVQLFSNYDKNTFDFDAGPFSDSEINNGEDTQFRFGLSSNIKYNNGNLKLLAASNKNERFFEMYNSWTSASDIFEYTGKTSVVDVVNNYQIFKNIQLVTGINYQKQDNTTRTPYGNIEANLAKYTMIDPYVTAVYNSPAGFNLNVGARLNNHSEYGNHWVYTVNPSYNISKNMTLLSSFSTAFITPSTYQLFSQYGNINLKPEENKTLEFGFAFKKKKTIAVNSVFFYRKESNAIILPNYITYQNASENVLAKGVETTVNITAIKNFTLKIGHAYTYKNADIDYIPKNKLTALFETTKIKDTYLSLRLKSISKRTYFDQWGTGENIVLKAYSLADFYGNYSLVKDKLSLFFQINNIFNKDFVETIGYTTKGRNVKIGLRVKI